jgi:hypothetical protein
MRQVSRGALASTIFPFTLGSHAANSSGVA